jgi:hypothetical protein
VGGGDSPGAVPVDDPVPVAVPGDEVPVDVLDDEAGWVVAFELGSVVDDESPGVWLDPVADVPVTVGVSVGVVEDPAVVLEVLLSEGAEGLTPPPLWAVEVPPVGRSLILTGVFVVIEVDIEPGGADFVGAFVESLPAAPAAVGALTVSLEGNTADDGSLDRSLGAAAREGAA